MSKRTAVPPLQLRQYAEADLAEGRPALVSELSPEQLLHELQVHQIELEMQNESLRQAHCELAASWDRYVDLYDLAPVGYVTLGPDGRIEQLNLAAASLLGQDRPTLIGHRFLKYVTLEDQDRWYLHVLRGMRLPEKFSCEIALRHGTAPLRHVQADCQRVAVDENVFALRVVLVDISERKSLEAAQQVTDQALQQAREAISIGQRASHAGVWDWDVVSGKMVWTEELFQLFGLDSTVTGASFETWGQLLHPEDRQGAETRVQEALRDHRSLLNEYRIRQPGGEVRCIHSLGEARYDARGQPLRMAGVCVDITERRRAENELASVRSEMQALMGWQVARHTVAALAHEINQPLSSLTTLCEAVTRMLAAEPVSHGERLGECVQRMALEAERAGRVVRELLASLQRPESKGEKMAPLTLLQESLRLAQNSGFTDCRVFVDCPGDLPAVQVNRLQVEKVMLNLMGNSVDAMAEVGTAGGRIWLRAEAVAEGVRISVADEGPGIGKEMAQQMFHPFVTSKTSGIGMGLSISRSLVEMQGGKLWFDAQEGPGAVFHFTLPIAR